MVGPAGSLTWSEAKGAVQEALWLPEPFLHVVVGLAAFLALSRLLKRQRHGALVALALVAAAQCLNEVLDARDWIRWTGRVNWAEAAWDTVLTLALPVALSLWALVSRVSRGERRGASREVRVADRD